MSRDFRHHPDCPTSMDGRRKCICAEIREADDAKMEARDENNVSMEIGEEDCHKTTPRLDH